MSPAPSVSPDYFRHAYLVNRHNGHDPVLGDNARVCNGALIDCRGLVTLGADCFVGYGVMILTGTHDYQQFGRARQEATGARPVTIGEGAWIGSGAIVCPGVTVGAHAVVAPGAVVLRNVPTYGMAAGNPARTTRRIAR